VEKASSARARAEAHRLAEAVVHQDVLVTETALVAARTRQKLDLAAPQAARFELELARLTAERDDALRRFPHLEVNANKRAADLWAVASATPAKLRDSGVSAQP